MEVIWLSDRSRIKLDHNEEITLRAKKFHKKLNVVSK